LAGRRTGEQRAEVYAEDELRDDGRAPQRAPSAAEAAEVVLRQIVELTRRDPVGVTSVEPIEDGWSVEVEVVEAVRIPSSSDMLAVYSVEIDLDGTLLSYRRTRRYPRGRSDGGQ
jgi:hypothetical protein